MKVLFASTPLMGHLNPLLGVARILIEVGHEVIGLSASVMRGRIEGIGAGFLPFPAGADLDLSDRDSLFPEWRTIPPGPERARFGMERAYMDVVSAQHQGLREALQAFPADLILADNFLFGVLPMLLGPRAERPPIALCGVMFLPCDRDDGAPHLLGLPPAAGAAARAEYAAFAERMRVSFYDPVQQRLNERLRSLNTPALESGFFHAMVALPDRYLQLTVPQFEFPRTNLPASVRFVGAPPIIPGQAPLPPWASELDEGRKVVLVTQGTLSNFDFSQLVTPALAALANEPDVLVVVTTGGRPVEALPGPIPTNVRAASYLPFEWLLPRLDAMVTNGGYGSVNQALGAGVPLVTAGLTEDKADVNARVAWSGAGLDLMTNSPTPEAVRRAVRTIFDDPAFRARAAGMKAAFDEIDTRAEILRELEELANGMGAV